MGSRKEKSGHHAPAPDRPSEETISKLETPKPALEPDFFTPLVTMMLPPEGTEEPELEDQLFFELRNPLIRQQGVQFQF
jgi:hypothetical protein